MQCLPKRNSLTIYFTTYTSITNIRMDMISKIQDGCSLRKLEQISLWSKDIDLILIKIHLELIHQLKVRSEEHTSELQSRQYLVCRLLLEKKKKNTLNLV